MESFVVKHYTGERPSIKGNGFDGLEIGETRDEAEAFVARINELIAAGRAVNTFYVFLDSLIPFDFGGGARDALRRLAIALRSGRG